MVRGESFQKACCTIWAFGNEKDAEARVLEFKGGRMRVFGCVSCVPCKPIFQVLTAVGAAISFDKVEISPVTLPCFCKTIWSQLETVSIKSRPDRIILLDPTFKFVIRIFVAGSLKFDLDSICKKEMDKTGIAEVAAALRPQERSFVGGTPLEIPHSFGREIIRWSIQLKEKFSGIAKRQIPGFDEFLESAIYCSLGSIRKELAYLLVREEQEILIQKTKYLKVVRLKFRLPGFVCPCAGCRSHRNVRAIVTRLPTQFNLEWADSVA